MSSLTTKVFTRDTTKVIVVSDSFWHPNIKITTVQYLLFVAQSRIYYWVVSNMVVSDRYVFLMRDSLGA